MKHLTIIQALVFLFSLVNLTLSDNKCRILALSGGGDKGAYQAGAIYSLIQNLSPEEVQYDVVSGISVGALNGAMVAIIEKGKEKEVAEELLKSWRSVTGPETIYKDWPFGGVIRGLLFQSGLYDTSPEYDFLMNVIKRYNGLKRDFTIGVVNMRTGRYESLANDDFSNNEELVAGTVCSSAFPGVFPLVEFKKESYTDGGVIFGTDIPNAVQLCENKGFQHKDIILDMVMCSSAEQEETDAKKLTTIPALLRVLSIKDYRSTMSDLEDAREFMKDVEFRYVIGPSKPLPSGLIPLSFNPTILEEMIQLGISDANKIISEGIGIHYKEMTDERYQERKRRWEARRGK